jgi:aminotransferase
MTFNFEDYVCPIVSEMPPSGIRKFFDLVANTKGVISLGVGEPDFVTPSKICDAAIQSIKQGKTMYTSNYGMLELRAELANHLLSKYKVEYNPENEMIITIGASEGVDLALRSFISPGDEVLVPEPCYVSYSPCVSLAGGIPKPISTVPDNGFKLTPEQLESAITPKSKILILCYPNNPTGAIMSRDELMAIGEIVKKHNLIVISDEIYSELTYEGNHCCFSSLPDMRERTILLNGFSKAYSMTGWRIGYVCAPKEAIKGMVKIHQYTILCAPIMAQIAAIEALKNGADDVKEMVNEYNVRRKMIVNKLNEIGMFCVEPKGAFYVFPSIQNTILDANEFAEKLLQEEKVAVVPGDVFGASGVGHIRISYASATEDIKEALIRIERFVKKYTANK